MKNWWFDADGDLRVPALRLLGAVYETPGGVEMLRRDLGGRMADGQGLPGPTKKARLGNGDGGWAFWGAPVHSALRRVKEQPYKSVRCEMLMQRADELKLRLTPGGGKEKCKCGDGLNDGRGPACCAPTKECWDLPFRRVDGCGS